MRHADRPSIEAACLVAAPPARVWRVVSDLDLLVGFSQELRSIAWEGESGVAVGRQFVGTNRNKYFGEWQTTSTITECVEPEVLAWTVGDVDHPNTNWRFQLTPDGEGTRLTQSVRLGTGPSGLAVAIERMPDKEERIVERRLEEFRTAMQANLDGIRALAEQP